MDLLNTVCAFDSTTIDLCLSLFPWAFFHSGKSAIKLHTLLDLRGSIPAFIHITDGRTNDVRAFDELLFEAGSFYLLDRGYLDFARLYTLHQNRAFFIIRAKSNLQARRTVSRPVDKAMDLISDHIVALIGNKSRRAYPESLRRVRFFDRENDRHLVFMTNNFFLPAHVIAQLYKLRWQVELFFRWIKQNLRIKSFYGTSENAVRTQIWAAMTVYVLVAIIRKKTGTTLPLYTFLQVISVMAFEKIPLNQLLTESDHHESQPDACIQFKLI